MFNCLYLTTEKKFSKFLYSFRSQSWTTILLFKIYVLISFGNFTKEDQSSTTFHQVLKGDSSRQFSLLQPVLVRHLRTFPSHISWLKEDVKSAIIEWLKKFLNLLETPQLWGSTAWRIDYHIFFHHPDNSKRLQICR